MKPPYQITSTILALVASISGKIGQLSTANLDRPPTELRRRNKIKTIHSSLEIEGNTLTEEQITALLENRPVLGPQKDILEVRNAIAVYDRLREFDPFASDALCEAHGLLMAGLVDNPGRFRTSQVGIMKGDHVSHLAPPALRVPTLMDELFSYLARDEELLLIKSCVFHYEFEFIHPFLDGNGRMGRLWQTCILAQHSPVFEYLPVEVLVKQRQQEYYAVLESSDQAGDSTAFIEFMLRNIDESLEELLSAGNVSLTQEDRLHRFREQIGDQAFTRQDYLRANRQISAATASRDLSFAVQREWVEKFGDKRTTVYRFKDVATTIA